MFIGNILTWFIQVHWLHWLCLLIWSVKCSIPEIKKKITCVPSTMGSELILPTRQERTDRKRVVLSTCLHLFTVCVSVYVEWTLLCSISVYCFLRAWLWLKGWTVFVWENGSHCRLGSELLNQALHSQHRMWKESDWSWATQQRENKWQDWIRNPLLSWNLQFQLAAARQSVVYMGGVCDVCRL